MKPDIPTARAHRRAHLLSCAYALHHDASALAPLDRAAFEALVAKLALLGDTYEEADHLPHTRPELDAWFGAGLTTGWQHETPWTCIGACNVGMLYVPEHLACLFEHLVGDEDDPLTPRLKLCHPDGPVRLELGTGYADTRLYGILRDCTPEPDACLDASAQAAFELLARQGIAPQHVGALCRLDLWATASLVAVDDEPDGSTRVVEAWSTLPMFFELQRHAMQTLIDQERILARRIELRYLFVPPLHLQAP
jgi:hypothetical protein